MASPFNPNQSMYIMDDKVEKSNAFDQKRGSGLTMSHFNSKHSPKRDKAIKASLSPRKEHPTFPNFTAQGAIKGQKISMKNSPNNYNILGELDLKKHFLKKLNELRVMKEEYYSAPEEPDPIEIL